MSRRPWEGGYVHRGRDGRDVYVIRRQVGGRRFDVSTRCHTAGAALVHLARFEADPDNYSPRGERAKDPIILDGLLAQRFLEHSLEVKRNSRKWALEQKAHLVWWSEQLGAVNLRGLSLTDAIIPALDGTIEKPKKTASRAHRIATLKALYAWLRRARHLLTSAEDPTLDLEVPQSSPAQRHQVKERTTADVAKVRAQLSPKKRAKGVHHFTDYRDHLDVLTGTAWHVTELARFARGGRILEATPQQAREGAAAVLETVHKGGEVFRTRVGARAAKAARRIHAAGGFSIERYAAAVARAAAAAKVDPFRGALRHSVLTWVTERAGDAAAAQLARHRSPRTTKKHYAERAAPPNPLLKARRRR